MFFAPPKVKSLSLYADFGTHLGQKYFFIMLAFALLLHSVIIGVYALAPREEVVRIPVRVINIKLNGSTKNTIEIPSPPIVSALPASNQEGNVRPILPVRPEKKPETPKPVNPHRMVTDTRLKPRHEHDSIFEQDFSLATPKKYIREGDLSAELSTRGDKQSKGGNSQNGDDNVEQRYEQTISLWISHHRVYPNSAKQQGIEGNAVVRVRIDRKGHLLYYAIEQSSGNALIDEAVIGMVQASNPVPRPPDDYPAGNQIEFLIPVSFRLQ